MTTKLTDASGAAIGDALALVERVDSARGEVPGTSSDRQFRLYVRLTLDARNVLGRSREFKRGIDNSVFHRGYPMNCREQGGVPSIQVSIALDGRRADIDVDYRSSSFPLSMFNGHLSAANSDVRAGNNADRHAARWSGLQNWWRGFFGVRLAGSPSAPETPSPLTVPKVPRAGKKTIDVMAGDFLRAWLVEGNVAAAMAYISDRSYSCLAQDAPDPSAFDRGLAPFQLMVNLKAAYDALGPHDSLDGLTMGVRLALPALKVVQQPHHAQFVIYSVPDDVAMQFNCDSRLISPSAKKASRTYGNYFGSTFYLKGSQDQRVALLWARENGYWKIVSWKIGLDDNNSPAPVTPDVEVVHIKADPDYVRAAKTFLETWLIRKDYDSAFRTLSTRSYPCYDLGRAADAPASTSLDDAGNKLRAALERIGQAVGAARRLEDLLEGAEPFHPAVRVMDHAYSRTFTLVSLPNALGDAIECEARVEGVPSPDPLPLDYGTAFAMNIRFRTVEGGAPVLRLLWRREDGAWKVRSYAVELP